MTQSADDPENVAELIERLNTQWRIAGPDAARASFRQRLLMPLRTALTRLLRTQETFNSLVVQYVNHQHHTISEEHQAMMAELDRYREALHARERRMETAMTALLSENAELKTAMAVLQAQIRSRRSNRSSRSSRSEDTESFDPNVSNDSNVSNASNDSNALSSSYVGFEDQFRGSAEDVRARLLEYVPLFTGASDVLDVGCGRGEFLRLLAEHAESGASLREWHCGSWTC